MKIEIITFVRTHSYGAFFQAYALQFFLESRGHSVEVVDYFPTPFKSRFFPWYPRHRYLGFFHPTNFLKLYMFCMFSITLKNWIKLSRRYSSHKEIQENPPEADMYICGSDQIWNPVFSGPKLDGTYFCDFGPDSVRRISYAASFGVAGGVDHCAKELSNYLHRLNDISCREKSGCEIVKSLGGKEIVHVVDPTLLLSEYKEFYTSSPRKKPYVLQFGLNFSSRMNSFASNMADELGISVVTIEKSWKIWKTVGRSYFCSPKKWLNLMRNADFIVTNSFHGTVFCILFKVNFVSFALEGSTATRNERITGLLKSLGLLNRFIECDDIDLNPFVSSPDWMKVHSSLDEIRKKSIEFLERNGI